MNRYRYILSGTVKGEDQINSFRLIGANNIKPSYDKETAIRVSIPSDLKLEKWSCDPYSTTEDERTLDELGYDVLVWHKKQGRWRVHNEFKGILPCDIVFR
ncbi:hypothetical protein [Halobacillus litoralis]|uniref:hypothetical protein n=1 Tax=Halobacillus litoralis TaxID=45668 RepID=UPI001CD3902D|nr:hypothetical protein [Halobacillus litoralis]MCA1021579.1 hypothetical protein [Halobacillus litoralis]